MTESNVDLRMRHALELRKAGRLRGACRALEAVVQLHPTHATATYNLALFFYELGEKTYAEVLYRRAIDLDPLFEQPYVDLGRALSARGKGKQAAGMYALGAANRPRSGALRHNLGAVLLNLNRPQEAAGAFRESVALEPNNAHAHGGLGRALAMLRDWPAPIAEYERAIALNPADADAYHGLGCALALNKLDTVAWRGLAKARWALRRLKR